MRPQRRSVSATAQGPRRLLWLCLAASLVLIAAAEEQQQQQQQQIEQGGRGQEGDEPRPASKPAGICAMSGCNCTVKAHHWVFVKCVFADYQDVDLAEGMIPEDTMELDISHCRELRIQSGAFSGGAQLKRVHVSGIYTLVANRQAFQNLSAPNPLLEVSECNRVVLESHAFKNTKGPLSVAISRCKYVTIKPNAFSWLLRITVREVPNLELSSNAFKFETPQHGRHGPATKIVFQSVKIKELPTMAFPSTAAEIRMDDLWAGTIKKDAFCAMNILSVLVSNASIYEIEPGAFSDRTLIHNLEFVDVKIKTIRTGAFRAGANNLTIQFSRLSEVETGAIDITVASVSFNNNEFHQLRRSSIKFHQWNRIAIDANLFQRVEADAISAVSTDLAKTPSLEFSFFGNHIEDVEPRSLSFAEISQSVTASRLGNNYFKRTCNCHLEAWIRERLAGDGNASIAWMLDSSHCMVDKLLTNCFQLPEGYLSMRNYTETICSKTNSRINCTNEPSKPEANGASPSPPPSVVGPHQHPRYFDVEMSDPDQLEREKRIIVVVCVVAVFSLVVVVVTSGVLYMRRRGVCPKLTSGQLRGPTSWFSANSGEGGGSGMTAATSSRSISRLSVHEYAGLHAADTRVLEIEAHEDASADDDEACGTTRTTTTQVEGRVYAYMESRGTQTLPEELTDDYLAELRERLNDPQNYSYARDVIEHLYDLVKVEESCNNNTDSARNKNNSKASSVRRSSLEAGGGGERDASTTTTQQQQQQQQGFSRRTGTTGGSSTRKSASVGTKVPSLDKLLLPPPPPPTVNAPLSLRGKPQPQPQHTIVADDYALPCDQRLLALEQNHLYAELPGDETSQAPTISSASRLQQQQLTATAARAPQPLPPDVAAVGERATAKRTSRPAAQQTNFESAMMDSWLNEYADPTEVAVLGQQQQQLQHLYSEPLTQQQQQRASLLSPGKMANRPLPTKPDLYEVVPAAAVRT